LNDHLYLSMNLSYVCWRFLSETQGWGWWSKLHFTLSIHSV